MKLFCEISFKNAILKLKNEFFLRDFLQNWSFETQKRSISARLPSKTKLWSSKTKLLYETSFKNATLKIKNETFLRDFFQKWSFEAQKRSFCTRLPSKTKFWSSKTKLLYETSFKNATLKFKNETFLRDFLQKWSFEAQKRSFCTRLPSKMRLWRSKTKYFCDTSFKNDKLTRHLTSEFQYILTIFKWTLQNYCACHQKVEPRHTKSCNCHAKWSLQSNASVTWNLQPFLQSAKSLCLPRETHRFRPSSNPPRLPTFLQPSRTPAPATYFATCRNPCACHANYTLNLKKRPETVSF